MNTTIGNGISNYAAQNLGAGKFERIREGFKAGFKLVWILCLPLFLIYFIAGRYLLYLFIDAPSVTSIETGIVFLRILSPFYFIVSIKLVEDGILRGTGMMKKFIAATFTDLILRVTLAAILSKPIGSVGIWCAWPIGWSIVTIMSVYFYHVETWQSVQDSDSKV